MKTKFIAVAAALALALGLSACDFLNVEQPEDKVSTLTTDIDFVATKVVCKHFQNVYADYPKSNNYFLELTSESNGGQQHVMILDLITPLEYTTPEAEYTVGYEGKFIALSRFDVYDPNTGLLYRGGCYYGLANNGYIGDTYGYLTEGTVNIFPKGEEYVVSVNAKSEDHTVKVFYQGPLEIEQRTMAD